MKEIWKDIKGYEGYYQISNFGKVKGLKRYVQNVQGLCLIKEKILKNTKSGSGYYWVLLSKNGKHKMYSIHRLVGKHFIPNLLNKSFIHHKDSNRANNHINNLEWVSPQENTQKSIYSYGKLNKKEIIQVYNLYPEYSYKKISKKFNVSEGTIQQIIKGKSYKQLLKYNPNDINKNNLKLRRILTNKEVKNIRNLYPKTSYKKLSKKLNISLGTLWHVVNYKTYKDVK